MFDSCLQKVDAIVDVYKEAANMSYLDQKKAKKAPLMGWIFVVK